MPLPRVQVTKEVLEEATNVALELRLRGYDDYVHGTFEARFRRFLGYADAVDRDGRAVLEAVDGGNLTAFVALVVAEMERITDSYGRLGQLTRCVWGVPWACGGTRPQASPMASEAGHMAVFKNPTFFVRAQPPTANRRQPPPTANRQPPTIVQYCPCLDHEAESVPVNVVWVGVTNRFLFFPPLRTALGGHRPYCIGHRGEGEQVNIVPWRFRCLNSSWCNLCTAGGGGNSLGALANPRRPTQPPTSENVLSQKTRIH